MVTTPMVAMMAMPMAANGTNGVRIDRKYRSRSTSTTMIVYMSMLLMSFIDADSVSSLMAAWPVT